MRFNEYNPETDKYELREDHPGEASGDTTQALEPKPNPEPKGRIITEYEKTVDTVASRILKIRRKYPQKGQNSYTEKGVWQAVQMICDEINYDIRDGTEDISGGNDQDLKDELSKSTEGSPDRIRLTSFKNTLGYLRDKYHFIKGDQANFAQDIEARLYSPQNLKPITHAT